MRLTVGRKMAIGFTAIVLVLLVMGGIAYNGMGNMTDAANKTVEEKDFAAFLTEKEVDHLVWMQDLLETEAFQTEFTSQLDYKKCGFGKWYYTVDKSSFTPEQLAAYNAIEEPHIHLHESASVIVQHIDEGNIQAARDYYFEASKPALEGVQENLHRYPRLKPGFYFLLQLLSELT